ncbi:MAG: ABC transporter ATP-binding protein [Kiritimatiellaeota bacterium]|nr:ABC transporter ATP-binding protein [Kiritimatiellota bacterium]
MKLDIENLSYRYTATPALDGVSLSVAAGQLVTVIGLNGAGKTTLLRCLSTLTVPQRGTIFCDGQPLARSDIALRRRIFFIPDTPQLFPDRTVIQNLAVISRIYGADTPDAPERAIRTLRELDMLPHAYTPVRELSRGQQYKTALTALVLVDADLWLLDEPFAAGMDPLGNAFLRKQIRAATARGKTVLYTTQLPELAEQFSDTLAVLHQARLCAFAPVADITAQFKGAPDALEAFFQSLRDPPQ